MFIHNFRQCLVALMSFSIASCSSSHMLASSQTTPQSQHCFSGVQLEPSFIAFTTSAGSRLDEWYKDTFALEVAKTFASPDGRMSGVLMHRDEFIVEIFYLADVLSRNEFAPTSNPSQWEGIRKFGVYSDADLLVLKQCLIDQGVNAGRIFKDDNLNVDLLLVTDPEQNTIEIIRRHPERR